MVRVKIMIDRSNGFQETAILPVNSGNLSTLKLGRMTHYANKQTGRLLLSVDTADQTVNYCDPTVMVEHKLDGNVQFIPGNKPRK